MKLIVTLREMLDLGVWDEFCELKGLNPWCINEGLADGSEEYELSFEECSRLGISLNRAVEAEAGDSSGC